MLMEIIIYQNFINNDLIEARKIQGKIIPVNSAVTAVWGVPALKAAMDSIGLYGGKARSPILEINNEVKTELLLLLENNGIKRI